MSPAVLADVALGEYDEAREAASDAPTQGAVHLPTATDGVARVPAGSPTEGELQRARKAIHSIVDEAPKPVVSAVAAHAVLRVFPDIKESRWWGAGSFGAFLSRYIRTWPTSVVRCPGTCSTPAGTPSGICRSRREPS